jgi:hypothetical protein
VLFNIGRLAVDQTDVAVGANVIRPAARPEPAIWNSKSQLRRVRTDDVLLETSRSMVSATANEQGGSCARSGRFS